MQRSGSVHDVQDMTSNENYDGFQVGGIDKLPPSLQGPANEVQFFCQADLNNRDKNAPIFNWGNFIERLNNRPNTDLTISKMSEDTIVRHEYKAGEVVEALLNFLQEGLEIVLSDTDANALRKKIETGFTNLTQRSEGFLFKTISDSSSSWQYSVLFALEVPNNSSRFVPFVSTFHVTADVTEHSFLWFTLDSVSNFSVQVKAAKLFASTNFKAILPAHEP
ncbi:hypothetical protein FBU30_002941 [Linnemannia zychae]|nr:hypothetical protein FBU30_002941 [Linnemannia zychae]